MPEIEHNDEGFHYVVYWKKNILGQNWNSEDIMDWRRGELVIPDQPTFQEYKIRVIAINRQGEANIAAKEVTGYSGEDGMRIVRCFKRKLIIYAHIYVFFLIFNFLVPLVAPLNFTLIEVTSSTEALFSWNPVPPESVRGHFKGYKV